MQTVPIPRRWFLRLRPRFTLLTLIFLALTASAVVWLWCNSGVWGVACSIDEGRVIYQAGFTPDGKKIFTLTRAPKTSGDYERVIALRDDSGSVLRTFRTGDDPGEVFFPAPGTLAYSKKGGEAIVYWDIETGTEFGARASAWPEFGDGKGVVTTLLSGNAYAASAWAEFGDGTGAVSFHSDPSSVVRFKELTGRATEDGILSAVSTPDGKWVAAIDVGSFHPDLPLGADLVVISTETKQIAQCVRLSDNPMALSFSGLMVSQSGDKLIARYDWAISIVELQSGRMLASSRISPWCADPFIDGGSYALFRTGANSRTSTIYYLDGAKQPVNIQGIVRTLVSDHHLAFGSDYAEKPTMWDLKTGQVIRQLEAHDAFFPDGRYVFHESTDGPLSIIDAATGALRFSSSKRLSAERILARERYRALGTEGRFLSFGYEPRRTDLFRGSPPYESRDSWNVAHLWKIRRPAEWWGIAWLPEFWTVAVLAALSLWSVLRDRRTLRRMPASRGAIKTAMATP